MLPLLLSGAGRIAALVLFAVHFVAPEMEVLPGRPLEPPLEGRRLVDAYHVSLDPPRWEGLRLETLFAQDLAVEPAGEERIGPGRIRAGTWGVRSGIGFTEDPTAFLLALGADYYVTEDLSVGPLLQFGLDDDPFIFAPTLNAQWTIDLKDIDSLKPYVQAGLGFAYMQDYKRNGDEDDLGFLINTGAGVDWYFNDRMAVGTCLLLNALPDEVINEEFFFSWQVLTLRFVF